MDISVEEQKRSTEQHDDTSESKMNDYPGKDGNSTPSNTLDVNRSNQPSNICCNTCESAQECEEDIDNPGIYYCRLCWEEYALNQQQQQQEQGSDVPDEKSTVNLKNDNATQSQSLALTQPQTQAMTQFQTQLESQQLEQSPSEIDEKKNEIDSTLTGEGSPKDGDAAVPNDNAASNTPPVEKRDNDLNNRAEAGKDEFSKSNEMLDNKSDLHVDIEAEGKLCAATLENMTDEECDPSAKKAASRNDDNIDEVEKNGVVDEEARSAETVVHDNITKSQNDKALDDVTEQIAVEKPVDVIDQGNGEQYNNSIGMSNETNVETKSAIPNEKSKFVNFLDDDEDPSVMTQEVNIASKMDGLLTQAASMSEDEEDVMDGDGEKEGIDFEYEGVKMNADMASRPPTIDTSEQIPLSGLTGPSQHLSNKSDTAEALLQHKDMMGVAEMEVDPDELVDGGQTEETFGSLYGAETQMLPPMAPQATNHSDAKNSSILNQSGEITNAETEDHDENNQENSNREQSSGTAIPHPASPESNSAETNDMKVTPRKGVLSMISYPNDENSYINSPKVASGKINPDDGDDLGEGETEQSQDLLETSPMSRKQNEGTCSVDSIDAELKKSHCPVPLKTGQKVQDVAWLSNRHEAGSPRLVLPTLKSNAAQKGDANDLVKTTAEEQHSMTAEETDDESMFDNYNAHPLESDPIEDTQTQDLPYQKQPTHLKRLSRGTPKYSLTKDDSTSKSVSLSLNTRATNSSHKKQHGNHSNRKSKSKITPKVLHYARREENGESDAEFEGAEGSLANTHQNGSRFQQSEITARALKQLEEVEEFTKHLPSIEEMKELASRKELHNKISEVQSSHNKEINRLRKSLKQKEDLLEQKENIIREKDKEIALNHNVIKDRDATIVKQQEAIKNLMNQLKWLSPSMSAAKKRMHTEATADDSDSDSESDRLVLSALKQPAESSRHKKQVATSDNVSASKPTETGSTTKSKKRQESATKGDSKLLPFSSQIWKELQDKGWKHKTGPEPYNKGKKRAFVLLLFSWGSSKAFCCYCNSVYVPPDGSTHAGTSLGIHFFHAEQVLDAAIKRGHIIIDNGESSIALSQRSENEWSDEQEEKASGQQANVPIDDSKLVGRSKLITLESGRLGIELIESFMRQNQESASFKASLFSPLWHRLKMQGGESNKNWRYERCTGVTSLSRNWCHVPPSSDLGSKGKKGADFFVTEEEVVLQVLQEVRQIPELSSFVTNHESMSSLTAILTRAVEDDMVSEMSAFAFFLK